MIRGELHKMENSSRVISFMDEIKDKIRSMQKEVGCVSVNAIYRSCTQIDTVNAKPAAPASTQQDSHINTLQGQLDELKEALSYLKQTTGPCP